MVTGRGGLARRRRAVGHTQESLAAELFVDRTTVANWETGRTEPQPWHRPKLAAALDISLNNLDELLPGHDEPVDIGQRATSIDLPASLDSPVSVAALPAIIALRRMADVFDMPDDGPTRPLSQLEQATSDVIRARLNSEYSDLLETLPELVPELTRALFSCKVHERPVLAELLVQAYRAADAIADKLGFSDLSARMIHLMRWAAKQSGNPLVLAATSYVRAETFFASGQLEAGRRMLERAAGELAAGSSMDTVAGYGALHMRAAVVAARAGAADRAYQHLTEAKAAAGNVTEGIYCGTAFGPGSVRIHEVTLSVELDVPDAALAAAVGWVPPDTLPAERRSHFYIDLAHARVLTKRYGAALDALDAAQQIAPEHVRAHPDVREAIRTLARADRGMRATVENFVSRAGVPLQGLLPVHSQWK